MPEIGQTISHYRIVEKIGQGGMGEVYLAEDLTLDRKVALKFLPDAFTSDPERMARFEREAKLLASLNHPNIAGIYGLEQADGNRFLVLEYVEGETLQARLSKGALPLEDALALCRQIAEGLEAAHEKGVIHRDLKPANVMITAEEKVKILDFGLAKAFSDETQSIDSSQSPTLTEAMTQPGVILGTAAYMSPEQAKGKSVDRRADIWAFGCILYECLTGKKVFEGETVTETLAAILREKPDWQALPATTPHNIRFLLKRCLAKERNKRFRDTADVQIQIEEAGDVSTEAETVYIKRTRLSRIMAAAAVILIISLAIPAFLYFRGEEPAEAITFYISTPQNLDDYAMEVSPDGRLVAYTAISSGSDQVLCVRRLNSLTPEELDGTEGVTSFFWSPDSRSIAFIAEGRLRRKEISGGPPKDICIAPTEYGGTWGSNGTILLSAGTELHLVSAEGGEAAPLLTPGQFQDVEGFYRPNFLPDGRHYFYSIQFDDPSKNGVYLKSIDSDIEKRILDGNTRAFFVEPGYLLYHREGTLFAQPFNAKKLSTTGGEVRVSGIDVMFEQRGYAAFSASINGVLIYREKAEQIQSQFVWYDRTGERQGIFGEPQLYFPEFDLSPDEKMIAMTISNPSGTVWDIGILDIPRNIQVNITNDAAADGYPRWSPDGKQIAYTSRQKGGGLYVKELGASGIGTLLLDSPGIKETMGAWSQDGQYIAYVNRTGPQEDIWILPISGEKKEFPFIEAPGVQNKPVFSPDGKWLAYQSNESGKYEIYVVSFPGKEQSQRISNNGGVQPHWRDDGRELYYLGLDGELLAVDINPENIAYSGKPHILFETKIDVWVNASQYSVAPDGQRFLILEPLAERTPTPITVVTNWTSLLVQ